MAEQEEISDPRQESLVDRISEKLHSDDSSSSSDSDSEAKRKTPSPPPATAPAPAPAPAPTPTPMPPPSAMEKVSPVHKVLGGGKPADVFLWRDKKISASVLGVATAVWVLFELLEYHLITLVCHISILALGLLFLYSNATTFVNKKPPHIPEVRLPEEPFREVASALRVEINRGIACLREIAAGRDLKSFLLVVAGLWFISIVGSFFNFLTLFYIAFVLLHIVPVLYEKYDDKIDACAEKAMIEIKKQYEVFDAKVLRKIPRGPSDKKRV